MTRRAAVFLGALGFWVTGAAPAGAASPIVLHVDAREATRKIYHAMLTVPAAPGPLTLVYPKWLPGEHGPTGPITDLANLHFSAGGKPLDWHRDPVAMYAFGLEVPAGAAAVDVSLDFLSPALTSGFSSGASASSRIAMVSWNQVLLYPKGSAAGDVTFQASLEIPKGWKFGTALPLEKESDGHLEFKPVSLTELVDSPVLCGSHFRVISLTPGETPPHEIDIAAESSAALEVTAEHVDQYKKLVAEAKALFGARHYRDYRFLLTLSDHVAHFGLEHHESSDDRIGERAMIDEPERKLEAALLPHEYVHSWNGKHRRPAGLATRDFQEPMKGDLLWVYEGLTQYLGQLLTARSGLLSAEEYRESLAAAAATLDNRPGRTWRPLADTAVAAQLLYFAAPEWDAERRGVDYYDEGWLIWLEADVLIREKSKGARSLDDFCRRFHGGASGPPSVLTYTFQDVVSTLNDVAPHDWRAFLTDRLERTSPHASLGGIESGGYRLVYNDTPNDFVQGPDEAHDLDKRFSLGFKLKTDASIVDVIPDSPAAKAGLGPGMKIVAVNGRRFSAKVLKDALWSEKVEAGAPGQDAGAEDKAGRPVTRFLR